MIQTQRTQVSIKQVGLALHGQIIPVGEVLKDGKILLRNGEKIQLIRPPDEKWSNKSGCFGVPNTRIPDRFYSAQPFLSKQPLPQEGRAAEKRD